MKGFTRAETRFSLCGLNCALCSMHLGGYCPGCGGGAGNQSCAIAKCSLEHGGVQFCWECPEYPCSRYEGFDDGDSFVPHRNRQQDIAQARELGLDAYLARQAEKRAILDELLAHYNDGRRKTLFNTAVYLLPLEDLRSVMAALGSRPELTEQPVKERALAAVGLLQEAAVCLNINLKLNTTRKSTCLQGGLLRGRRMYRAVPAHVYIPLRKARKKQGLCSTQQGNSMV